MPVKYPGSFVLLEPYPTPRIGSYPLCAEFRKYKKQVLEKIQDQFFYHLCKIVPLLLSLLVSLSFLILRTKYFVDGQKVALFGLANPIDTPLLPLLLYE